MKKRILSLVLFLVLVFAQIIEVPADTISDFCLEKTNIWSNASIERTGAICKYCNSTLAKAICNRERDYKETLLHGNCTILVYTSTCSVQCDFCSRTYQNSTARHECLRNHKGCSLGRVSVCPIT